jgi:hypothetical protein
MSIVRPFNSEDKAYIRNQKTAAPQAHEASSRSAAKPQTQSCKLRGPAELQPGTAMKFVRINVSVLTYEEFLFLTV